MIRELALSDINRAHEIWEKHFRNEFEFPDFLNEFICAFTIESDDKIIGIAGIKPILESVIVLDQDFSPRKRRYALYEILAASEYMGKRHGFNQLHASVQNHSYREMLKRCGFRDTQGLVVRDI